MNKIPCIFDANVSVHSNRATKDTGGFMRVFAQALAIGMMMFSSAFAFAQTPGTAQTPSTETTSQTHEAANSGQKRDSSSIAEAENAPHATQNADTADSAAEHSDAKDSTRTDNSPGEGSDVMTTARLDKQIKEVGTSVDTLKEDTFTTKSRLLLLREEVLQRSVSGSRLQIRHKNDMGGQYSLVQVYYAIDQQPVFVRDNASGDLNDLDDEVVSDQMIAPGSHQLTVLYVYKGKPWGVFTYMNDYTFRVESGFDFSIDEGKAAELAITAAEAGNFFTAYEKRPTVRYTYEQFDLIPAAENRNSSHASE